MSIFSAIYVWPSAVHAEGTCSVLFTSTESVSIHESETRFAMGKILENISVPNGLPGAIIAARTDYKPNYVYHWIRDAALVVEAVLGRYQSTEPSIEHGLIRVRVLEYFEFSKQIQSLATISGRGEPKVEINGTAFNDAWGRPQNDSPALRAVSLITLGRQLAQLGASRLIAIGLGITESGPPSIIKQDLDYVVQTWRDASVDIWEEVKGHHFYTRMVQRRALLDGAEWAKSFGDHALSATYRHEAQQIETSLRDFLDPELGFIRTMIPRRPDDGLPDGLADKSSGIDIAVILGLLHGGRGDGFMSFSSPEVLSTLVKIEETFKNLYPINRDSAIPGTAIGRYPEDMFGGADRAGGNPWVLATLAMGEAYYKAAAELRTQPGAEQRAQELIAKGDSFVDRVRYHRHKDGSLNEQFHRETGHMHAVEDLTWSYAALVTALGARDNATQTLPQHRPFTKGNR